MVHSLSPTPIISLQAGPFSLLSSVSPGACTHKCIIYEETSVLQAHGTAPELLSCTRSWLAWVQHCPLPTQSSEPAEMNSFGRVGEGSDGISQVVPLGERAEERDCLTGGRISREPATACKGATCMLSAAIMLRKDRLRPCVHILSESSY